MRNLTLSLGGEAAIGLSARAIAIVVSISTLPLLSRMLSPLDFAALGIMTAVMQLAPLFELGIGAVGQNAIARKRAKTASTRQIVAIILKCSMLFSIPLLVLCTTVIPALLLETIGSNEIRSKLLESGYIGQVAIIVSLLTGLNGISHRLLIAKGKASISYFITALSSLTVLFVIASLHFFSAAATLLEVFLSLSLPPLLGTIAAWLVLKPVVRIDKPRMIHLTRYIRIVAYRAWPFWTLQSFGFLIYSFDLIILSNFADTESLASYSALQRILVLVIGSYGVFLVSLWPRLALLIYSRSLNSRNSVGDNSFRIAKHSAIGALAVGLLMLPLAPSIFQAVFGPAIPVPSSLAFLLAVAYCSLRIWTDTFAITLYAANDSRWMLKWAALQLLLTYVFQFALSPFLGMVGILIGLLAGTALTVAWVIPNRIRRTFNSHQM